MAVVPSVAPAWRHAEDRWARVQRLARQLAQMIQANATIDAELYRGGQAREWLQRAAEAERDLDDLQRRTTREITRLTSEVLRVELRTKQMQVKLKAAK